MKFKVTFKTPDAIHYAVEEVMGQNIHFSDKCQYQEDFEEFLSRWIKYGECITIEFDTELGTATVLKAF